MKYIVPTLVNHNALTAILGPKGVDMADDNGSPIHRTTTAGYESDE